MQRSGGVRSAPICYATFDGERQLTTSARELVTLMPKARGGQLGPARRQLRGVRRRTPGSWGGCNLRPTVPLMESLARGRSTANDGRTTGVSNGTIRAYNGDVQRNHQAYNGDVRRNHRGVQQGCPTEPSGRTARMSDGTGQA